MDPVHELELDDLASLGNLTALCSSKLKDKPDLLQKVLVWLVKTVEKGGRNIKLDTMAFFDELADGIHAQDHADMPLERIVVALEKLMVEEPKPVPTPSKTIVS